MQDGEPITADTVGELIAKLQTLDPEMRTGHRGTMGEFSPGISVWPLALMKSKSDPTYAAHYHDLIWMTKRDEEFEKPFLALCTW